jgi:hypothetical protein
MTADTPPEAALRCSAKGCTLDAQWQLLWNNPRIHTADRRKTWLACDEHRVSLSDFLGARGFLREVEPMPDASAPPPSESVQPPV